MRSDSISKALYYLVYISITNIAYLVLIVNRDKINDQTICRFHHNYMRYYP